MAKWILLALVTLPAVELGLFMAVASRTGLALAVLLSVATSLIGIWALRRIVHGRLQALRAALSGQGAGRGGSFFGVLGGVLLVLPGFLTDVAGALLLIPAVQNGILGAISRRVPRRRRAEPVARSTGRPLIDLAPGQWRQLDDAGQSGPQHRGHSPRTETSL